MKSKVFKDYEFQKNASSDITAYIQYHYDGEDVDSFMIVIPTGGGKTYVSAKGMKDFLDSNPGTKIMFVVPLQNLVSQTYQTMKNTGIDVSVVHNTLIRDRNKIPFKMGFGGRVIITMPETFVNIMDGNDTSFTIPKEFSPIAIVFDEGHKSTSEMNQRISEKYEDALNIGLSATPFRQQNKDGESLEEWYGENIYTYGTFKELIDLGRLVPGKYYQYEEEDNIVKEWMNLAEHEDSKNRKTIVFTQNTDQSIKLCDAFNSVGIKAEIITSGSDIVPGVKIKNQLQPERDEIYNRFSKGNTDILISVNALCEGWDETIARYCIFARKIQNIAFYNQMGGRVARSHEGKNDAIYMDFYGNVDRFGKIEDIDWSNIDAKTRFLEEGKQIDASTTNKNSKLFHRCTTCNHVFDVTKTAKCPSCKKDSNIRIYNNVTCLINKCFPSMTKLADIKNLISSVKGAMNFSEEEISKAIKIKLNQRYLVDIFDEDGNLTEDFEWINGVSDINSLKKTSRFTTNI